MQADPARGAEVNVVGTVNVFEAVRASKAVTAPIVYASSVAAYGSEVEGADPLHGEARTLYGVYKRANEGAARVYWDDHRVASIGLRPYVVYGPGRDFGMTAEPTFAMQAAAQGKPYEIGYGGYSHMQLAEDVARDFIAASRSDHRGSSVVNLAGSVVHMSEVVSAIEAVNLAIVGEITFVDEQLPFPSRSMQPIGCSQQQSTRLCWKAFAARWNTLHDELRSPIGPERAWSAVLLARAPVRRMNSPTRDAWAGRPSGAEQAAGSR